MSTSKLGHMIFVNDSISAIIESFILERKSQNLSQNTILYYQRENNFFLIWLNQHGIESMGEITADNIRTWLSDLGNHRNKGGVHANFRAIKAMFFYYENEYEPDNWKNPIRKVKIQANKQKPLPGISIENVQRLIKTCCGSNMLRDQAILQCLVSTGCRASEFLALNLEDINFQSGMVTIKHGKGDKSRITFIGKDARKSLRKYLNSRSNLDDFSPIWTNQEGERLTISGLRHIVLKYSRAIGLEPLPGLHDFRRCFALSLYRNGVEILMISQLLGHESIDITRRYLNINTNDLRLAFMKGNPLG